MNTGAVTALLFEVANQRYGLDVTQVVEVVPAVHLRTIPSVPDYVAGVFCYRGAIVPVLDLSVMLCGTAAEKRYSTRLVLVRYPAVGGTERVLGLLVERASMGLAEGLGGLMAAGITTPEAPYLGRIANRGDRTIQLLKVEQLIPAVLRERLFTEE